MITLQTMLFAPTLTLEQKRNSPSAAPMSHAVETSLYAFALLWRWAITIPILALLTACGGGDDAEPTPAPTPIAAPAPTPPSLALLAGHLSGTAASFYAPHGIATDNTGNVYVADTYNHTIRKITPADVVTTLAGSAGNAGSTDGTGAAARFNSPRSLTIDSGDNIYVADSGNHTIRKITPAGEVTTFAGTAGFFFGSNNADGIGAAARFYNPTSVTTDNADNIYVTDTWNNTIRKITPAGVVTTFAGAGFSGGADGAGTAARFNNPQGIVTDSADNIYVADTYNYTIRKITLAGEVTTFAGSGFSSGSADGTGAAARFNYPQGITADSSGNVYVADANNGTIRKITPAGEVTTFMGSAAGFSSSLGVATDSTGNVYVADTFNHTIRKITPDGVVTTLAGVAGASGSADGTSAAARLNNPQGITIDSTGNAYVADSNSNTIRKITPAGEITVFAGTLGAFGGNTDGTGAAARFNNPQAIATDSTDNIYVADTWNHTIRKITPEGVVTTFAGTAGFSGNAGGTGAEARFNYPRGITTDSVNNVYVADTNNSAIRKITPAGVVTTLAGSAGNWGSADGTGTAASFTYPEGIATDSRGNVYVADTSSHTIRKITPAGVVTTFAGSSFSSGSADGTGTAARFNNPKGIAIDYRRNVYVADTGNNTIRKITPAGVVTTLVGAVGQIGFAAGVLPGAISSPQHVAIRGTSLYITMGNAVVVVRDLP